MCYSGDLCFTWCVEHSLRLFVMRTVNSEYQTGGGTPPLGCTSFSPPAFLEVMQQGLLGVLRFLVGAAWGASDNPQTMNNLAWRQCRFAAAEYVTDA